MSNQKVVNPDELPHGRPLEPTEDLTAGSTRAKFKCMHIMRGEYEGGGESFEVVLTPVNQYDNTEENRDFWEATPSGKIELVITNKDARKFFTPGKSYYVDFTEAHVQPF